MFGYLKINRYELKLKDVIRHKKYYCTLCNDIGKQIGMSFRLFTSFDVTIFLHLFDMLYDDKIEYRIFCPLKPFQKKKTLSISKTALHLCTFLNAYWVYVKLVDDANDSHMMAIFRRNRAKSFRKRRKIKKLFSEYQSLIDKTNQILEEFHLAEKSAKVGDFDKLCNLMGDLYGTVCYEVCEIPDMKELFYRIGFIMGRWIYLSDALDDYPKDQKQKNINPINFLPENLDWLSQVQGILDYMQSELKKCFVRLPNSYQKTILLNLVTFGMPSTIKNVIHKRYEREDKKS